MNISGKTPRVRRQFQGFKCTEEQDHCIDLMMDGENLKINAFAGASKTFTMAAGSYELEGRGLYISFNKAIADEAAKIMKPGVKCKTAHSLAYGQVGYKYRDRLQRINGSVMADHLALRNGVLGFNRVATGNLVIDTITRFTQSASHEITTEHVPWGQLQQITDVPKRALIAEQLVPLAKQAWNLMADPNGNTPITHDVYLKLWTMTKPTLNFDYIMFDEAQDANPMMLDLVSNQQAQQIYVGDRFQQIYSWRGAVNAMDEIQTSNQAYLTQSFRFGQAVADVANDILNNHLDANVDIKGFSEINSTIGPHEQPDVIISRTNGAMLENLRRTNGAVHILGGSGEAVSLISGLSSLKNGGKTNNRELALFESWDEVKEYSETESGSNLKSVIKQMDKFGANELIAMLKQSDSVKPESADLILTSAHKSKGLEFGNVRLENDFKYPDDESYRDEETNILYVAATRAKHNLDIEHCSAALNAVEKSEENTSYMSQMTP
jgi:superfamily I DNA/RNA helicase